jgi:site-specific recombinase XerD
MRTAHHGCPLPAKGQRDASEGLHSDELFHSRYDYLFWSGIGRLKTSLTEWQARLKKVAVIAGIGGRGFAHRCRASFSVELLNKGVPLEMVATILGNTARVVELHYASFVQSRQVSLEAAVRSTW